MLRHVRSCKKHPSDGGTLPEHKRQKRGRKRTACDRCIKNKRRCDGSTPCLVCESSGVQCIWTDTNSREQQRRDWDTASQTTVCSPSRQHKETPNPRSRRNNEQDNFSENLAESQVTQLSRPLAESSALHHPFPFLLRFTSSQGFAPCFECGSRKERNIIIQAQAPSYQSKPAHSQWDLGAFLNIPLDFAPDTSDSSSVSRSVFSDEFDTASIFSAEINSVDNFSDDLLTTSHWLGEKSRDIVRGIQSTLALESDKDMAAFISSTCFEKSRCQKFFEPSKLERYLVAFWSLWYPNWPVFHKPTFNTATKPAAMVAAMALIGASLTAEKEDYVEAHYWSDAVDTWIFSATEWFDDPSENPDQTLRQYQVRAQINGLRASYAMVLFMTWEGNTEQKTHARRERFSQVVSMARRLIPLAVNHTFFNEDITPDNATGNWIQFAFQEELNRSLAYVFMLDCAFALFNNRAPQFILPELKIPLLCPEVCFQAETAEHWGLYAQVWAKSAIGTTRPVFSDMLKLIMEETLDEEQWKLLYQMSALNLFVIANGKLNVLLCKLGNLTNVVVGSVSQPLVLLPTRHSSLF